MMNVTSEVTQSPGVALPTKKRHCQTPDNKDTGTRSVFFAEDVPFFALRSSERSHGANVGRADMSSLVHSREFAKATALSVFSFGADLVAVF